MYTAHKTPSHLQACRSILVAEVLERQEPFDEIGETDFLGHYALVRGKRYGFIIERDSQGFLTYEAHPRAKADELWNSICQTYLKAYAEQEQEAE